MQVKLCVQRGSLIAVSYETGPGLVEKRDAINVD